MEGARQLEALMSDGSSWCWGASPDACTVQDLALIKYINEQHITAIRSTNTSFWLQLCPVDDMSWQIDKVDVQTSPANRLQLHSALSQVGRLVHTLKICILHLSLE
jgi:hypothetical protein